MFQQIIQLVTGRRPSSSTGLEQGVSFCESCNEVCTPDCRAKAAFARVERQRTFRVFEGY
jgi:hypothetical protein